MGHLKGLQSQARHGVLVRKSRKLTQKTSHNKLTVGQLVGMSGTIKQSIFL